MKRICFIIVLCILMSSLGIHAADFEVTPGRVIYHQNFSHISDIAYSGIKIGSLSTDNAIINCPGNMLSIRMYDSARVYMIFPQIKRSDTYTVEFSFSFDEQIKENGYIAFMLTCRGDGPSNISSVIIRANGTIDDFESPDEELVRAITSGKEIYVTIPVENNVLYRMFINVGDSTYILNRDKLLVMSNEDFGFAVRNASVNIGEVYVMDGVDYSRKIGYYSENSYATDEKPMSPGGEELSPETADGGMVTLFVFAGSAAALIAFAASGRKRK